VVDVWNGKMVLGAHKSVFFSYAGYYSSTLTECVITVEAMVRIHATSMIIHRKNKEKEIRNPEKKWFNFHADSYPNIFHTDNNKINDGHPELTMLHFELDCKHLAPLYLRKEYPNVWNREKEKFFCKLEL